MPLLMIENTGAPPLEQALEVPGGEVRAFSVGKGQLLAVTDIEGGQPAALFATSNEDPGQFLSPHHTRVFSNSFMLRLGMRLVTNYRRPAMVLSISPAHLSHDLLVPMTEGAPTDGAEGLRVRVAEAFHAAGVTPLKIADPVNLFLDVVLGLDGSLTPNGVSSQAGDSVVFRVVMDMVVAIAAPQRDERLWTRVAPGPIGVQVRNEVAHLAI
jgi:uncharacterized protein YcgI (DUF1989 family)